MSELRTVEAESVEMESIQVDDMSVGYAIVVFRVPEADARRLAPLLFTKVDLIVSELPPPPQLDLPLGCSSEGGGF